MNTIIATWRLLFDSVKRLNNKISKKTDGYIMVPLFDNSNKSNKLFENVKSNIIEINIYLHDISTFTLYPDKLSKIISEMAENSNSGKLIILNSYVDYEFLLEFPELLKNSDYTILRIPQKHLKYRKKKIIKNIENLDKTSNNLIVYSKYKFCKEIKQKLRRNKEVINNGK